MPTSIVRSAVCAAVRGAVVFALIASVSGAVTAKDAPSRRELREAIGQLERGRRALEGGNLEMARRHFTRALASLPDFPEARIGLGHVAMREKRFQQALVNYLAARAAYRDTADALYDYRSRRYFDAQRRLATLRQQLAEVARQNGTGSGPAVTFNGPARRTEAQSRDLERQLEERIRQLEQIRPPEREAREDPPAELDFFIGNALFNLDRLDEAIEAWEACADRTGKFPLVHNNLAVAYWRRGEIDRAWKELERAEAEGLKVDPSFRDALAREVAAERPAAGGDSPHRP